MLVIQSEAILIKILLNILKILALIFLCLTLNAKNIFGQDLILKPNDSITPYYTLEEWIYSHSNWSFNSYDFNSIDAFTPHFSSNLENEPALYIDGERYLSSWLNDGTFNFPEISFSQIDSVIIQPYQKITNGEYTPQGNVQIFLKDHSKSVLLETTFVNQVNDPGLNLGSELSTPNVEYVHKTKKAVLNFPSLLNSTLIYSGDDFSRTNGLDYDQNRTNLLLSRTLIRDESGDQVYQRNRAHNFVLQNTFENSIYVLNLTSSYNYKNQYYTWHPLSGVEVPSKHRTFQAGINFKTVDKVFYKNTQLNYSYSTADTLEFQDIEKPKYNLNEQQIHHTTAFGFDNKQDKINLYLNNIFYHWEDFVTENSTSLLNNSINVDYLSKKYGSLSMLFGNYNLGFEYRIQLSNTVNIDVSTFRSRLESSGYNYTFWNEGIGFSNLDPSIHSVTNASSFTNTYSTVKLSSAINKENLQLSWNIYPVHYWQFLNTTINYEIIPGLRQLGSEIIYSDEKNVGFIGFYSSLKLIPLPKINLRTTISGRLHTYGSNEYLDNAKGINNFMFSQSILYRAHRNAFYELSFRYISPREIHEYESLEASSSLYTSRVHPIKMLNASFKTWLIDRSLLVTLSLRNLLNSTESYNTNGQYYNMSIHFSAVLHIGKK
ncbi:MAG: hypothetical protein BalsKO_00760 [Balneolaceae bacterium]